MNTYGEEVLTVFDEQGEQDIEVNCLIAGKQQLVAFTWPCGESFSFPIERLIEFNERARKAGQAASPTPALLNMAELEMDYYALSVNDEDLIEVWEAGDVQAAFPYADMRKVLLAMRKQAATLAESVGTATRGG